MKTAYHQSIKRRQKRKKDKQTNKKVKVFPKEMSKDYTIYTKSKQTKAKKLKCQIDKTITKKRSDIKKSNIDIRYLG